MALDVFLDFEAESLARLFQRLRQGQRRAARHRAIRLLDCDLWTEAARVPPFPVERDVVADDWQPVDDMAFELPVIYAAKFMHWPVTDPPPHDEHFRLRVFPIAVQPRGFQVAGRSGFKVEMGDGHLRNSNPATRKAS